MFEEFLLTYDGTEDFLRNNNISSLGLSNYDENNNNINNISTQQKLLLDYRYQIEYMIEMNKSTLYINFQHVAM